MSIQPSHQPRSVGVYIESVVVAVNVEEFERIVFADPLLADPIRLAARAGRPAQLGVIPEPAVWALMFPIAYFVLRNIGLPWLHEIKRYSELHRQKLHR